jgi:hypothetical protein
LGRGLEPHYDSGELGRSLAMAQKAWAGLGGGWSHETALGRWVRGRAGPRAMRRLWGLGRGGWAGPRATRRLWGLRREAGQVPEPRELCNSSRRAGEPASEAARCGGGLRGCVVGKDSRDGDARSRAVCAIS